jgi:hypothetical protein
MIVLIQMRWGQSSFIIGVVVVTTSQIPYWEEMSGGRVLQEQAMYE